MAWEGGGVACGIERGKKGGFTFGLCVVGKRRDVLGVPGGGGKKAGSLKRGRTVLALWKGGEKKETASRKDLIIGEGGEGENLVGESSRAKKGRKTIFSEQRGGRRSLKKGKWGLGGGKKGTAHGPPGEKEEKRRFLKISASKKKGGAGGKKGKGTHNRP